MMDLLNIDKNIIGDFEEMEKENPKWTWTDKAKEILKKLGKDNAGV
ncbi:MAG: hypothetical protein PHE15_01460 [Dehalococcoidales bacterium]|jgi:hypothetical protein|nr:hypothetical protein [Dehalococcoidales bacterium]